MKIAFVSFHDINNRTARSGVPYSIYKQFSKTEEVDWINPVDSRIYKLGFGIYKCFQRIVNHFGYSVNNNTSYMSRIIAWSVNPALKRKHYDAIFTMLHFETVYLNTNIPCYTRTDTLFRSATEIFGESYPQWFIKHSYALEKKALNKLTCLFAASQWMVDEAGRWFPALPKDKIQFIETGANLDDDYIKYESREYGIDKPLKILFAGFDIKKKGLDIAFETMLMLRKRYNLDASLTAIGGTPPDYMMANNHFRYVGKLDKNKQNEFNMFYDEFAKADIFLFPTRNEYHGIVNCEAAAYALPIFSHDTCGVSSYVIDGVNGHTLPLESSPEAFADKIYRSMICDKLSEYASNSRKLYEERFNWEVWGKRVLSVMRANSVNKK